MQERIGKLRQVFDTDEIDAFYIMNLENRYYLSGFTGSTGALLLTREQSYLLTDFRYLSQAAGESPSYQIVEVAAETYGAVLLRILQEKKISRLGVEGDHLTYNQYVELSRVCTGIKLKPLIDRVEGIRILKDRSEIELIEKAVSIADQAFAQILPLIKQGVTEQELALELEYNMRRLGASGPAFKFIVASGVRSALPHGVASSKTIAGGELVTFDFGAVYQGYHSDITRTVVVDSFNQRQQEIYQIVLAAQMNGVAAVKAGATAAEVDYAARSVIEEKGYGKYFGHSTGHGLGLNIHENPRLSIKDKTILAPGMVVTIEPGIYIEDWGGVRIEDTVLVEKSGCRVLTGTPKKELLVL